MTVKYNVSSHQAIIVDAIFYSSTYDLLAIWDERKTNM